MTSLVQQARSPRLPRLPSAFTGKLAYGALFVLGVPALLFAWARATEPLVPLPAISSPPLGIALIAAGLALLLAGMWALWAHGGGLPMNAFPPPRLVERGAYALVPHPIYTGFSIVVLGASIHAGSASGLWLVTPFTILGCAALVLGYERHDLARRFGVPHAHAAFHVPADDAAPPSFPDRLSPVLLVLLPAILLSMLLARLGPPPDAVPLLLPGEDRWPAWPPAVLPELLIGPALLLAAALAPDRALLRRLVLRGLCALALGFTIALAFPLVMPLRSEPPSLLSLLAATEHRLFGAAFPSLAVLLVFPIAAALVEIRPAARALVYLGAFALSAGLFVAGTGSLLGVLASALLGVAVIRADAIWETLRRGSERIANSWREVRIGRVRIINHGLYGALATFVGVAIAGALAGPESAPAIGLVAFSALVCSAIWAQVVEGSSQLLRPYGFYGGVVGIILGALLAPLAGSSTWLMLAVFSVAGPFTQSLGRLRCLVQGCCHGSPASPAIGITYTHPRSRVCRLAHLAGRPVHPTPLYSILWNVVIALVLMRLWSLHAALHLIGGLYLMLTGVGRFVEESYRGEPQTKIWAHLRLYQWIAIATLLGGILVTMLGRSAPAPAASPALAPLLVALVLGLLSGAALGVDFPSSERRFSRLA
ncbi:MAG: prolipoprotein diacylglyceryl transferase family protein [Byssovorax sp.]